MPTNYSGNPANVTTPLVRVVNGASAGSGGTVRISTTVAHLYSTHDVVTIANVVGTTEANGTWSITVISSTTFDLIGSTFTNAYVSGGAASDQSLTPYFQMPSNGEVGTVAGILASIQALADRTQYLAGLGAQHEDVFTASGTWTCPPLVTSVELYGYGGGGGGGGSGAATAVNANSAPGGGGGGASVPRSRPIAVVPGTVYSVTIGAGGTAGNTAGGGDGGNTLFDVLATFRGASGGQSTSNPAASVAAFVGGGTSVQAPGFSLTTIGTFAADYAGLLAKSAGEGGCAFNALALGGALSSSMDGAASIEGYAGGAGANAGATAGGYHGGGAGGGGAAGAGGVGGAGGAGGAGNAGGAGVAGTAGTAATANTGGGGGGGGAGGQGTSLGAPSLGGAGGSGKLVVGYTGTQAVIT